MSSYRANRNGNYSSEKDHANKNNTQNVKNAARNFRIPSGCF